MKNYLQQTILQGIRDLHIKILQANNLPEISKYLQEILDNLIPSTPELIEKTTGIQTKDIHKSGIVNILKSDIKSIVDGTYNRLEIAKFKATLDIARLKRLFTDQPAQ